jgi:hypothetical protein
MPILADERFMSKAKKYITLKLARRSSALTVGGEAADPN